MKPCEKLLKTLLCAAKEEKNMIIKMLDKKAYMAGEESARMKKSAVVSAFIILAAGAGALGMGYYCLLKRQKELEEYEQLLFDEQNGCSCGAEQQADESGAQE